MPLQMDFPGRTMVKNPPANAGDVSNQDSIPGSGRYPGGRYGSLQYSCLENPRTEELGGPQPIGLQRVGHDRSNFTWTHLSR